MLVLARTSLAAAILLPIALLRVDLRPVLARWRWVVAFAAVEIAIPWVALGSAEQHISSSLAGLADRGRSAGRHRARARHRRRGPARTGRLVGLLIGLIGVAAIVGGDYATIGPDRPAPDRGRRRRLRRRAGDPGSTPRRAADGRRHGAVACAVRRRVYIPIAAAQMAGRRAVIERLAAVVDPCRHLHGGGVPPVRRADRRDRSRAGDGDHVRQPGRGRGARRRWSSARRSPSRWQSASRS